MPGPTIPNPPIGNCTPGTTLFLGVTCNSSGEAYDAIDWHDTAELAGFAPEGKTGAKKCGGSDPLALVRLGAEIYREGFLHGFHVARPLPKNGNGAT